MANEFYALISRMRYIARWGLMRNSFPENVQEHSHMAAVLAHGLALIRRDILQLPGPEPEQCAAAGLYHDASEILTGDLPTPVKYANPEIQKAYKQVERVSGKKLLSMLPEVLRPHYEHLILEDDPEIRPIIQAADKLSAYIKAWKNKSRETWNLNRRQTNHASHAGMNRPELDYFLQEFLPHLV